jgi:predicted phosphoribosyltransferase
LREERALPGRDAEESYADYGDRLLRDRVQAGELLAGCLEQYRDRDVLVFGVPRGGVPVAAAVARALHAELDVVVARKLGAPGQPELAIGAVTANGGKFVDEEAVRMLGVSEDHLRKTTEAEMAEAHRREERFRGGRPAARIKDRVVIIVDDGLATGATMRAAARSVKGRGPAKLVLAVPVGSPQACAALRQEADEVVCPYQPDPFWAVGLYYQRFEPTQDEDVAAIIGQFREESVRAK